MDSMLAIIVIISALICFSDTEPIKTYHEKWWITWRSAWQDLFAKTRVSKAERDR